MRFTATCNRSYDDFGYRCRLDAVPGCCDFIRTGAGPFQTISVPMLALLAVVLPIMYESPARTHGCWRCPAASSTPPHPHPQRCRTATCHSILLIRHALLRRFAPKAEASLRDVALGFFFVVAMTQAATNLVKTTGHPRPNHYALRIYASLAPPGRIAEHYEASAWHAFPSGHCSLSMATAVFLSLLLLSDIRHLGGLQHQCRAVLVAAACLPIFLACFIAASRVFDYFHSEAEATCGMLFGGFWALVGFLKVIPSGERVHRPLKWL